MKGRGGGYKCSTESQNGLVLLEGGGSLSVESEQVKMMLRKYTGMLHTSRQSGTVVGGGRW